MVARYGLGLSAALVAVIAVANWGSQNPYSLPLNADSTDKSTGILAQICEGGFACNANKLALLKSPDNVVYQTRVNLMNSDPETVKQKKMKRSSTAASEVPSVPDDAKTSE